MELIKTETVEKGDVDFVDITGDSWTANHQYFLYVMVHGISSDFKNHLVLPSFATYKTGPVWKKWCCYGKSVWECCHCCSFCKDDCCYNNRQWNQHDQKEWEMEKWKMALCCCSHVEQGDKEHNEERTTAAVLTYFQKSWGQQHEVQPSTSEENGRRKERDQEDQWLPRDKVWIHLHICAKDILEKEKWDKLCEIKEERRKVVVGNDFFKETTKVTLKLALEPLFFVLEFFRMTGWASPHSVVFTLESQSQHWEHLTLALTFLQRCTPQWTGNNHWNINNSQWPWLCNNSCSCPWPFHTEKLSGWQKKNFLTGAGTQSKRWHLLTNNQNKREWRRRRECNSCFDEDTDEEIEKTVNLSEMP